MESLKVDTIQRQETKLIGYTVTASLNQDLEQGLVVHLREALLANCHEIADRTDNDGLYLIQIYTDEAWTPDVPFQSIVAVEVNSFPDLPALEGLIHHTLPAGQYAKVTHLGPEAQITETYDAIREQDIASHRCFDLEYWPDAAFFDPEHCRIEIFLPLKA